jgi:HD superfamily phosphohydrolase
MSAKIFRDPLYNYISIDPTRDRWLIELLDCPEVQRLRRIHQLGVSHFTYPGADHSRLSHSLGVVHLMQIALSHIASLGESDPQIERGRHPLLAAALLHDVGHGPYSHVFESCLDIDHETWSCAIIECPDSSVNRVLRKYDIPIESVSALIKKGNEDRPAWQKSLLSSQLDVDRLDYLRRDSLFTGADYGHFDWYRLLTSFTLDGPADGYRDLVWEGRAKFAIEEYIFSRYYMYENVYFHKTTRGFEKLLQALWQRAKELLRDGSSADLVKPIRDFWKKKSPGVSDYLAIEEHTVLFQMQQWTKNSDNVLSDLSRRFLTRNPFAMIKAPQGNVLGQSMDAWEAALKSLVASKGFAPADFYVLRDDLTEKLYEPKKRDRGPYVPEPESDEQVPSNAIRVLGDDGRPVEITKLLTRLANVTKEPIPQVRYYIPREIRKEVIALRQQWCSETESR